MKQVKEHINQNITTLIRNFKGTRNSLRRKTSIYFIDKDKFYLYKNS